MAAEKARGQIVEAHVAAQATSRDTPVCERPRAPRRQSNVQEQGGIRSAAIQPLHYENHRKPQSLCALGAEAEGAGCAT